MRYDTGGGLIGANGSPISLGYDQWGYNYEAHMFNGWYDNYLRPTTPVTEGNWLMMKWNDTWLSNQSCDTDNLLDRHLGFSGYRGSGSWLTNHASGDYPSLTNFHWDVTGDWVIAVNDGAYPHDYTFTMTSLSDGTFTGVGGYPAGSDPYAIDEVVINGQITGDDISFTAVYYVGGFLTGYSWTGQGTIDGSGNLVAGTGDSGVYEWHSTSGEAAKAYDTCYWDDFVKVVAVPIDAVLSGPTAACPTSLGLDGTMWSNADGTEIGCSIWTDFAVIQDVYSDPCGGAHYAQAYHSPFKSGLGNW